MSDLITGPDLDESIRKAQSLTRGNQSPGKQATKASASVGLHRELEAAFRNRFKPLPSYLFYVEVSELGTALFSGVSGIGMSRDVETVREGGKNDHPHLFPGPVHFNNITLTRGLTISRELIDWFTCGLYDLSVKRCNLTIYQGAPGIKRGGAVNKQAARAGFGFIKQWSIAGAYPVRWQLSDLSVKDADGVVIETVELAFENINLTVGDGT